jgi:hypothetical protein
MTAAAATKKNLKTRARSRSALPGSDIERQPIDLAQLRPVLIKQ